MCSFNETKMHFWDRFIVTFANRGAHLTFIYSEIYQIEGVISNQKRIFLTLLKGKINN